MTNEETLTDYMQWYYSDERLAALLAHTEDGKTAFNSCCCFIGLPTATHALTSRSEPCPDNHDHVRRARGVEGSKGDRAEDAFLELGFTDEVRRARLLPLIYAEIERRDRERSLSKELVVIEQAGK